MKKCTQCDIEKEKVEFPIHSVNGRKYINSWCRKCCRIKGREKYRANREVELEKKKEWQRKNPEKVKEIRRKTTWKIKVKTLNHYGGKCACCGETEIKFLAIDHIDNDGGKDRKRAGASCFYYWIKRNDYPTNLQVLCHNCNMAKSFYKICPHQE